MNSMPLPPGENKANAIAALLLLAVVAAGAISASSAKDSASSGNAAAIEGLPASRSTLAIHSMQPLQFDKFNTSSGDAARMGGAGEKDADKFSPRAEVLIPLQDAYDYKIILDISPEPAEYIPGAISIPYTDFLSESTLKTLPELAEILSQAGISQDDAVLIYGQCQPCGGGPSAATYVYWIMKHLGHSNVSLMDGGIDEWVKAGKPTAAEAAHLLPANYTPTLKQDLLASYPFVRSGGAQIIDARGEAEFEAGSIPSSINIPYDRVLDGKRIKDDAALSRLFSSLDKDRPVVVYTNTGVKASMIWLALTLLDYDASIYSWKDWQANSASS
ncbi:MAG: rhodanese domain-containing protein [Methanosaeta sp. NSM2]|nr:sulfurtransferase [Methanothrix sp.]OYV14486.1 MAG: rhodanese domain-containing protein [Methanosaeta sp. NSM2]